MNHVLKNEGQDITPLYEQVKQFIIDGIRSQEWRPGDKLPSEHELTRRFGISRMTINRALRELTSEGVVRRVGGLGSFVAERKPPTMLFEVRDVAREISERGNSYECHVIAQEALTLSPHQAAQLQLPSGRRMFHSSLIHLENGVPLQLEERWVNPELVPDYLELDFHQTTAFSRLSKVAISEVEHRISAVLPEQHDIDMLQLVQGEPCMLLVRRTWSGKALLARSRFLSASSRYSLYNRFIVEPMP